VEGQGTLSETAARHHLAHSTVIAWYRRDNWTAARNRWLAKQLSDNEPPAKPPSYTPNPKNTGAHGEKLQRLELQLSALDNALDNAKSPDEWQKLTASKHRLFEQWRILSGIPLPGSRRPAKERPKEPTLSFELPQPLGLSLPPNRDEIKPVPNPIA
jgi:hypothetical protein